MMGVSTTSMGAPPHGQAVGFTYHLTAGSFYDAPNTPSEPQLLARLSFTSKTARVMTYAEYYRRTPGGLRPCHTLGYTSACPHRDPSSTQQSSCHPCRSCLFHSVVSVWRTSSIKRPLARMPKEDLVVRFQLLRQPPASFTDIGSLVSDESHSLRAGARYGWDALDDDRDAVFAGGLDSALWTSLGIVPKCKAAFRPEQCADSRTRNVS